MKKSFFKFLSAVMLLLGPSQYSFAESTPLNNQIISIEKFKAGDQVKLTITNPFGKLIDSIDSDKPDSEITGVYMVDSSGRRIFFNCLTEPGLHIAALGNSYVAEVKNLELCNQIKKDLWEKGSAVSSIEPVEITLEVAENQQVKLVKITFKKL